MTHRAIAVELRSGSLTTIVSPFHVGQKVMAWGLLVEITDITASAYKSMDGEEGRFIYRVEDASGQGHSGVFEHELRTVSKTVEGALCA